VTCCQKFISSFHVWFRGQDAASEAHHSRNTNVGSKCEIDSRKLTNMKKTILLTQNGLSGTVSKWLFVILGLSNSINGVRNLTETPLTNWGLGLGILLLASGLLMATLGLILFNPTNMFAPKFVIDDNQIQIREDVHVKTKTINWNDIKEITYKSFALDFLLNDNSNKLIILRTNGETSVEIKKSIREIADKKSINIIGG